MLTMTCVLLSIPNIIAVSTGNVPRLFRKLLGARLGNLSFEARFQL